MSGEITSTLTRRRESAATSSERRADHSRAGDHEEQHQACRQEGEASHEAEQDKADHGRRKPGSGHSYKRGVCPGVRIEGRRPNGLSTGWRDPGRATTPRRQQQEVVRTRLLERRI